IGGKWAGLLKEAVPSLTRIAIVLDPDNSSFVALRQAIEGVAPTLGLETSVVGVHNATDIERGIAAFADKPNGGLIVLASPVTIRNRDVIIVLAARYRLPAIYMFRYFATSGGLMVYGVDQLDQWRGAAEYVDRILRGDKPGDLPVQAPSKYELVIN